MGPTYLHVAHTDWDTNSPRSPSADKGAVDSGVYDEPGTYFHCRGTKDLAISADTRAEDVALSSSPAMVVEHLEP